MVAKNPTIPTAPPTVAIIIPLYNKALYIRRALNSVMAQTCQDFEIIVVDDGSNDGGNEIVGEFNDRRIRLVVQDNAGVSAARNRGIELARSALIAFLDADDEWLPEHLAKILELRRKFPQCEVFGTGYLSRSQDGRSSRNRYTGLPAGDWDGVIEDYFDLARRSDPPLWSSAVAASKTALDSVGGFPVKVAQGEDLLTWARLAARYSIAYSTTASAIFWRPPSSEQDRLVWQRPDEGDPVGRGLGELLEQINPSRRASLAGYIGAWHKIRGSCCIMADDVPGARREFAKARRYLGWTPRVTLYSVISLLPAGTARQIRCNCVGAMQMWSRWRRG